jgi:hypothetical protein
MVKRYRGSGSARYHPALLLRLLVYGYTTGVFSSRKLERASFDSVAFRFLVANDHPDHKVLELAREMRLLKLGTVGLDCTKIDANASRHSAPSYHHGQERRVGNMRRERAGEPQYDRPKRCQRPSITLSASWTRPLARAAIRCGPPL